MAGRQSRGRQRIPMKRIEAHDDLYATFSKRRLGLYKKASELSTLCGVDVGLIIFSPTNNPFSFWHPSVQSVIERHRNPYTALDAQSRFAEFNTRARIEYLNGRLDGLLDEKERLKDREKEINEMPEGSRCWEEICVDGLDKEQVEKWKAWFQDLNSKLKGRLHDLEVAAAEEEFPSAAVTSTNMFPHDFPPLDPSTRVMNIPYNDPFLGEYYNVASFGGGSYAHFPESAQYNSMSTTTPMFNHFSPHAQDPSTAGAGEPSTRWRNTNP